MLADFPPVADGQEDFLQGRDRDTIACYPELLPLSIKIMEEFLELRRVFDGDLEIDFTSYLTKHMHFIAQILLQVRFKCRISFLMSLLECQVVSDTISLL